MLCHSLKHLLLGAVGGVGVRHRRQEAVDRSNLEEFLAYTDPQQPDRAGFASLGGTGDQVTVSYALPGREVRVEASTNLLDWRNWTVPGNDGLPLATGSVRALHGPAPGPEGFFRFQLREP